MKFCLKILTIPLLIVTSTHTFATSSTQPKQPLLQSPAIVQIEKIKKISSGFWLIPDPRINYIPNIGIIEGNNAILVIDTGMGKVNGQRVFQAAQKIAKGRTIYVTSTHFHPEHAFGAAEFKDAIYIQNKKQLNESKEKSEKYLKLFRTFGSNEANLLKDTTIRYADKSYSVKFNLDLGHRIVTFMEMPAHTKGDQIILDQQSNTVFMGDLYEKDFYPIMPDPDTKASQWINVLSQVIAMKPKMVVPGHGSLSTVKDLKQLQDHMIYVKKQISEQIKFGLNQNQITEKISPQIKKRYANWDNSFFLDFEIANFYAELTKTPIKLPSLN